jgi:hypothetical protein
MRPTSALDRERTYQRQRARFLRHLVADGCCDVSGAERLVSRWERESAALNRRRGSTAYWKDAWRFITGERTARQHVPKRDMNAAADGQVYGG